MHRFAMLGMKGSCQDETFEAYGVLKQGEKLVPAVVLKRHTASPVILTVKNKPVYSGTSPDEAFAALWKHVAYKLKVGGLTFGRFPLTTVPNAKFIDISPSALTDIVRRILLDMGFDKPNTDTPQ